MKPYSYHSISNARIFFYLSVAQLFTEASISQPTPVYTRIMIYHATKVAILCLPISIAFEPPR